MTIPSDEFGSVAREAALREGMRRTEDSVKALRDLIDERDRRYAERDWAARDAVRIALEATEKAGHVRDQAAATLRNSIQWLAGIGVTILLFVLAQFAIVVRLLKP